MKFKLFGGLDCPDWLLSLLAKVSEITNEQCEVCSQAVLDRVHDRDVEWETVQAAGIEPSDLKAILGALYTVVTNAVRYGLEGSQLEHELIMLGVREEVSEQLSSLLDSNATELKQRMLDLNPRRPTIAASSCQLVADDTARLNLSLSDGTTHTLTTSAATLRSLLNELHTAHSKLVDK
eukprot:TRINITY_DN33003_c0_g2_i1.p1 TRINITY_DN33003_c0_g2~~TRINITY_DN33003_c0_g2_i1.p1  ORF type:complete len:179 (+),score=61.58 TRINITY_DN33003_c0_g2_i1:46-582(+)